MDDDEAILCNRCGDLVGLRKMEAFPLRLFQTKRPGEWVGVRDFCLEIGVPAGDLKPDLFATWLADPTGQDAFAVIVFYDDETKWSMAAHYHRARPLERDAPHEAKKPTAASVSVAAFLADGEPAAAGSAPSK